MRGQVPLTIASPCNQFPGTSAFVGTTIFVKKSSHRDQNLVPATCPTTSNLFELKGHVPRTYPLKVMVVPLCELFKGHDVL